jgi:hypothetical protein
MKTILLGIILLGSFTPYFSQQTSQLSTNSPSIYFTENKGQIHDGNFKPRTDVIAIGNTPQAQVILTAKGMSHQLSQTIMKNNEDTHQEEVEKVNYSRVDMNWLGANSSISTEKIGQIGYVRNYLNVPSIPNGIMNVSDYSEIRLKHIYEGISVHYYSKNGSLEYDYEIEPGYNPAKIRIQITGTEAHLNEKGELVLQTRLGTVIESAPIAFQENQEIPCKWKQIAKNVWGFELADYDESKLLIIDPIIQLYGSYYGGTGNEWNHGADTDAANNLIIAGYTTSTNNIATTGAHQTTYAGNNDAFVAKFDAAGNRIWSTYFGGADGDWAYSCAVDNLGNIFLTGETQSFTGMTTTGAHQTSFAGSRDGILVKFSSTGTRFWSTYFGGTAFDFAKDCAVDGNGDVYISGYTNSTTGIATVGAHDATYGALYDAYLMKFNTNGLRQWGTYYGGTGNDYGQTLTVDNSNNVFLCGGTESSASISSTGSHQVTFGAGGRDGFIAKFSSLGVRSFGTYYGGNGADAIEGCDTDPSGNIVVVGYSASTNNISTTGAFKTTNSGGDDIILAKFTNAGVRSWGTFIGNTGFDRAYGVATDANSTIFITGVSTSTTGIATTTGLQTTNGGNGDALLMSFNASGARQYGTYLGSAGEEYGLVAVVDANNDFYSVGHTTSTSSISTTGAFQTTFGGGTRDGYFTKFKDCMMLTAPTVITGSAVVCNGVNALFQTLPVVNATHYFWSYSGAGTPSSDSLSVEFAPTTSGTLSVVAINECDTSASFDFAITINDIPQQPDTIFGALEYCSGLTQAYSVTVIPNALTYEWTYDGILLSETTENLSHTPTLSDTLLVTASNACGTSMAQQIPIHLLEIPSQPDTIIGSLQVCDGNSEIYSVTQLPEVDGFIWEYSPVGVLSEISDSLSLTPIADGVLSVMATNTCGNSVAQVINITLIDIPSQPSSIVGATDVCLGTSETYSVTPDPAANSYIWEYTTTGILPETTEIVTFSPAFNGTLSVIATNVCGSSLATTQLLTVNDVPVQPDTIFGALEYCSGLTQAYSVTVIPNALSYEWTYDGVLLSETTENLSLTPTLSDTLLVTASNACGTSMAQQIPIHVLEIPSQPDTIIGSLQVCDGNSEIYSVAQLLGVDAFIWEYSPVGVLSEISDSLILTPTLDGVLSVIATNTCGNSAAQVINITLIDIPSQPAPIVGPTDVCFGTSETYSINPVANADSYSWTYSGTGDATSSSTSTSFSPTSNATLSVVALNSCGTSPAAELLISVTMIETTVADNAPFLQSNQSGATYQWLDCSLNNVEIIGANNQIYEVQQSGSFSVEITLNGCVDTSLCVMVNLDNIIENNPFNNVVLYPNPINESVTISNLSYGTRVEIVDVMGKLVFTTVSTNSVVTYPTTAWANGTYFVKISKDSDTKTLPLVVIH